MSENSEAAVEMMMGMYVTFDGVKYQIVGVYGPRLLCCQEEDVNNLRVVVMPNDMILTRDGENPLPKRGQPAVTERELALAIFHLVRSTDRFPSVSVADVAEFLRISKSDLVPSLRQLLEESDLADFNTVRGGDHYLDCIDRTEALRILKDRG